MLVEEWRPVTGYENWYSVSNLGQVRRDKAGIRTHAGRMLKGSVNTYGYVRVGLTTGTHDSLRHHSVHVLVATAFLGARPAGYTVNHMDGNKQNNRADNLEYMTQPENSAHAARLGLMARGERNSQVKLSEAAIIDILTSPLTQVELAQLYGVWQPTISLIRRRKIWRHIQIPDDQLA